MLGPNHPYRPVDTKICSRCVTPKPLDQFRRRGCNDPAPAAHCKDCHRLGIQKRRERQRLQKVRGFVSAIEKADDDYQIVRAVKAAMAAFRGAVGFAVAWKAALESAPPGVRGRMLTALMQISTVADRRTYVDKSLWSDEDIDREMERLMLKIEKDKAQAWTSVDYVI